MTRDNQTNKGQTPAPGGEANDCKLQRNTKDLGLGYELVLGHDKYRYLREAYLYKDGVVIKQLIGNDGKILNYPNKPNDPPKVYWRKVYYSKMHEDGTFCFGYVDHVIQNHGDSDGFGVEPDETVYAYALLNSKGEYLTDFSCCEPEGYAPDYGCFY